MRKDVSVMPAENEVHSRSRRQKNESNPVAGTIPGLLRRKVNCENNRNYTEEIQRGDANQHQDDTNCRQGRINDEPSYSDFSYATGDAYTTSPSRAGDCQYKIIRRALHLCVKIQTQSTQEKRRETQRKNKR